MVLMKFPVPSEIYYPMKELSSKDDIHVASLALKIFKDYIRQHEKDLLHLKKK